MSTARDRDNREKKVDLANLDPYDARKRALDAENDSAVDGLKKSGIGDPTNDQLNHDSKISPPTTQKKKVKPKTKGVKKQQRIKQDMVAFPPPPPPPHLCLQIPPLYNEVQQQKNEVYQQKVNINTARNCIIPNDSVSSVSTPTTNTIIPASFSKSHVEHTKGVDKMQKLKFLTDLYDQGYITVVEYKERKSQIIDELTGTKTTTRTNSSQAPVSHPPPTVVASPPPDWSTIREETALRHVYDTSQNQWTTSSVKVKLDNVPFACGGLRKCYHLHDCARPAENYVAKLSIDPLEEQEIYFIDVEIQMHSKEFARKFNQYNPPKNVDFVMAWLLELTDREGHPLCGVETFIDGPYRKHNNNFGYVSEDERSTPQSFSHFTYEASNHKILICDIQGVGDLYTDPQMHTVDNTKAELMGKGNMGVRGISRFLATHQCNAICRYLRLPSINAKLIDAGTVPATTYMSYQKVDVVNIECHHPSPQHHFAEDSSSPLLDQAQNGSKSRACSCVIL